jgi:hypothetical protein
MSQNKYIFNILYFSIEKYKQKIFTKILKMIVTREIRTKNLQSNALTTRPTGKR